MRDEVEMKETGLKYLEKNRLLHIAMLEAIRRDTAEILATSDRGVLLLDGSSNIHMISAADFAYGQKLLDGIASCYQMVLCQEFLVPYAEEKFQLHDVFSCKKVAYFKPDRLAFSSQLSIVRPSETVLRLIKNAYHTIPEAEIDEIHRRGNLFAAFSGDDFVGFSGNHLDGSLGLLEIFPQYRGRGYGEQLERYMVNYILDRGDIPYGEIVIGNEASANLQKKLGFSISQETITWLL